MRQRLCPPLFLKSLSRDLLLVERSYTKLYYLITRKQCAFNMEIGSDLYLEIYRDDFCVDAFELHGLSKILKEEEKLNPRNVRLSRYPGQIDVS